MHSISRSSELSLHAKDRKTVSGFDHGTMEIISWKHPIRKPEDSLFGYTEHLWDDRKCQ